MGSFNPTEEKPTLSKEPSKVTSPVAQGQEAKAPADQASPQPEKPIPEIKLSEIFEGEQPLLTSIDQGVEEELYQLTDRRLTKLRTYGIPLSESDLILERIHEQTRERREQIENLRRSRKLTGQEHIYLNASEVNTLTTILEQEIGECVDALGYSLTKEGQLTYTFTLPRKEKFTTKKGVTFWDSEMLSDWLKRAGAKIKEPFETQTITLEFSPLSDRVVSKYAQETFMGLSDEEKINRIFELEHLRYRVFESLLPEVSLHEYLSALRISPEAYDPQADPLTRGRSKLVMHNLTVSYIEELMASEYSGKKYGELTHAQLIELRRKAALSAISEMNTQTGIEILKEKKGEVHRVDQLPKLKKAAETRRILTPEVKSQYERQLEVLNSQKQELEARVNQIQQAMARIEEIEKAGGLLTQAGEKEADANDDEKEFQGRFHTGSATREEYLQSLHTQDRSNLTTKRVDESDLKSQKAAIETIPNYQSDPNLSQQYRTIVSNLTTITSEIQQINSRIQTYDSELAELKEITKRLRGASRNRVSLENELKRLKDQVGQDADTRIRNYNAAKLILSEISSKINNCTEIIQNNRPPEEDLNFASALEKWYNVFNEDYNGIMERFSNVAGSRRIDLRELADPANPEITYRNWLNLIFEANTEPDKSIPLDLQQRMLSPYTLAQEITSFYGVDLASQGFSETGRANLQSKIVTAEENLAIKRSQTPTNQQDIDQAEKALQKARGKYVQFHSDALRAVFPLVASHSRLEGARLVQTILDHRLEAALSGNPFTEAVYKSRPEKPISETLVRAEVGQAEIKNDNQVFYKLNKASLGGELQINIEINSRNEVGYTFLITASQELLDRLPDIRKEAVNQHWPLAITNLFYGPNLNDIKKPEMVQHKPIEIEKEYVPNFDEVIEKVAGPEPPDPNSTPYSELRDLFPTAFCETALNQSLAERIKLFSGFRKVSVPGTAYSITLDSEGRFLVNNEDANVFFATYAENERKRLHPEKPLTDAERDTIRKTLIELKAALGLEALKALQSRK